MKKKEEDLDELLRKSIDLAKHYHKGQVDKGGHPYIEHPLAVMEELDTVEKKIVGVLHDVVEDTELSLNDLLNQGYPKYIVEGIGSVTRRKGESRSQFIKRAGENMLGRSVKIEDIKQNLRLDRIPNPTEKDLKRNKMYEKELDQLLMIERREED